MLVFYYAWKKINIILTKHLTNNFFSFLLAPRCNIELGYNMTDNYNLCIRFSKVELPFHQAQDVCRREGGHLLVINSLDERDYIKSLLDVLDCK